MKIVKGVKFVFVAAMASQICLQCVLVVDAATERINPREERMEHVRCPFRVQAEVRA